MMSIQTNCGPRELLFSDVSRELIMPIWTSTTPGVEEKLVSRALKTDQVPNEKPHLPRANKELENPRAKLGDEEVGSSATNSGLKQLTNRILGEAELVAPKGDD